MKKRWMKSIIETSKQPLPALPYQRGERRSAKLKLIKPAAKTA